ncbi:recombinase family protein [Cloacibacterium sp. TD35]|uniref:recombinase family protein n=1 Tax=Cloacibacterium sp. TD35 TaxID=2976818 RepID=UPI00237EE7E3|nr:recombinase family protein [Cloacibacterium sp. TD35]WDT67228.1 recombinase family protein [Cloacibacterium sp. TD35]
MRVKYNRVSSISQTGNRFEEDTEKYDLVLFDKVSGSVPFFERTKGSELKILVEKHKIKEIVVEEFSRLGRNTGDVINTLDWLEKYGVNVYVRNIGLYSRPNGVKNPIWRMISSVMSSLYEMELENIRERTRVGRLIYIQKGGALGRKVGTKERESDFINKPKSKKVLDYLKKGYSFREISKICKVSLGTIVKVKKVGTKLQLL